MSTFKDLLPLAAQVRDATEEGENTGKRVGDLFVDIIQEIDSYVTDNDEDKRSTESELIKRIQGTSESSDPMADPFVKLSAGGATALAELLACTTNKGRYRVDFGGYVLIDVNVFVRNSGVIVQSISGFIDKYDGGIDVAEKKNTFLRKGTPTEDAISWSEWAAVEGSNVRKITEENVAALNEEIARATDAETELLARLQGTSKNIDGRIYPFVKKDCANFDAIVQFLDEECISGDSFNGPTSNWVAYTGFTRVFLAGSFFAEVQIFFRNYANGFCTQVVKGNICIKEGKIANVIKNDMPYVTVWRNHTADGWGEWHLTDAELVGKSIAFFGGSMCNLAVGGGSLTQYTDATKSETFTEKVGYLREQVENLGATVANYAVSGSGFLRPIDGKTIYSQAQAAGEHDIYVIWASTNDWTMGTYKLGEFDDYQKDGVLDSICGGLNATISILLDKKRDAKIYVFLPMKGVDTRGFDPANGKYGNAMFDILTPAWKNPMGYTFGEYINAVLKVCALRGVAVVDTFSSPNLMYRAITDSAITALYWNEGLLVGGSDAYQGYFIHPRRAGYAAVWGVIKKSLLGDYGEHVVQQAAIYSEQLRAQGVESDLQEQITEETERAHEVEESLDKKINTEVKRATTAEAAAIEQGRQLALRALFEAAGALYNDTGADITRTAPWGETVTHKAGYYYLNGLGDITEDEMIVIYEEKSWLRGTQRRLLQSTLARTLLPPKNRQYETILEGNCELNFYDTKLEILPLGYFKQSEDSTQMAVMGSGTNTSMKFFCGRCKTLKRCGIFNMYRITAWGTGGQAAFYDCANLIQVYMYKVKISITLESSPNISKDSLTYLLQHATPTSAITITLHADAYARLAEDADIVAALEAQPLITLVSA